MTPSKRVLADRPRQAGSDGIANYVLDVTLSTFIGPKDVIEETHLPETIPSLFRVLECKREDFGRSPNLQQDGIDSAVIREHDGPRVRTNRQ